VFCRISFGLPTIGGEYVWGRQAGKDTGGLLCRGISHQAGMSGSGYGGELVYVFFFFPLSFFFLIRCFMVILRWRATARVSHLVYFLCGLDMSFFFSLFCRCFAARGLHLGYWYGEVVEGDGSLMSHGKMCCILFGAGFGKASG